MGKKNPLKSTSKKKNAKAKTDSDNEIAPTGETTEVKAAPKKAKGAKKQAAAKVTPAKVQPAEIKKTESKKERPLSIKELVLKKFDTPTPGTLFTVKADDSARKGVVAPPFVSGLDAAETERVRNLLFKKFDLSAPDPAPIAVASPEPAIEKAPEPPAPPVSIGELLKKKFDTVVPTPLYVPPVVASGETIESPPFVSGLDAAETERVRKLLFKEFDLSVPDPILPEAEPIAPVVAEKAPEVEVLAAEPEPEATVPEPEVVVSEPEVIVPEVEAIIPLPEPELKEPEIKVVAQTAPTEPEKSRRGFMEGMDPVVKKAIYAGCGLAVVFLLITIASFSNMSKYYLINKGGAVEVWRGRFAPLGKDRIALLTGAQMKKETKSAHSKAEVAPLIIENFVRRADDLMTAKGVPDFEAIRILLTKAVSFARESEVREDILQRLNRINVTALVFKATVNAGKESRSELETAREYLIQAASLTKEEGEKEMILQKLKAVNDKLSVPPLLKESPPSKTEPTGSPAAHH